ncbi:hypothetical protein MLD38_022009 [Melastoma candidum]|uniref:Uncharacterized protein n=1 Tax=Melastoma candidum TaxID=119954 RepID=A0ACB9QHS1_9MYRT|nr:hypothetical protein MLD38_022009 [Melastoma candidum]
MKEPTLAQWRCPLPSSVFRPSILWSWRSFPPVPPTILRRRLIFSRRGSSESRAASRVPKPGKDLIGNWVRNNDGAARTLPIFVGTASLLAVLLNRTLSGIPPVADASSSLSRADLLTLGLAVTNILCGLVWLSIRPKAISVVELLGVETQRISSDLPEYVVAELLWIWESLSAVTCTRSLVIVYDGHCIAQIGAAAVSSGSRQEAIQVDPSNLIKGFLYQGIMKSRAQNYLANLSLYPGRTELSFLPSNTQAVILQPLGERGIAVIGGDMIRGFTTSDQTWITYLADKVDSTLSKCTSMATSTFHDSAQR